MNIRADVSAKVWRSLIFTIAFLSLLAIPGSAQLHRLNAMPVVTASTVSPQLPNGVKIASSVSLDGQPITHMYTQWESGRTYLYIEHGRESLTTVDVTKTTKPQIVSHAPAKITPAQYEELAEGGTVQVSPLWQVNAVIDNLGGRGVLSVLNSSDPADEKLLQALGPDYSNLACRDNRLVFFASPSQLLIVQDKRLAAIDRTID